jgi:simple sugar transport system ATP-binding protein
MLNIESLKSNPLLEFCEVRKFYGSMPANDGLSFKIEPGKIHAIIGENGAGKTTAMKILFGLETPTSGDILFKGSRRPWNNARGALACGIGMVHQHFMLSGRHTALDNVILGLEQAVGHFGKNRTWRSVFLAMSAIDRHSAQKKLEFIATKVGFKIPWDLPVDTLPVGTQQQLEIMKLLYAEVDTMIFDEPTAVLSPHEKETFLNLLMALREEGKTIVVITHKLQEVKLIADVVTVFRRGKSVATRSNAELNIQEMADLMVGRSVSLGELPRSDKPMGKTLLSIKNLNVSNRQGRTLLRNVDLGVSAGQVVGIAGVDGSGQRELWDFICGPKDFLTSHKLHSGEYEILGRVGLGKSRGDLRKQSMAIIPADRLRDAVLLTQDLLENDLLGHDHDFFIMKTPIGAWIDRKAARHRLNPVLSRFDVRPLDASAKIGDLSGGNQQKFVIGREFSRFPSVIFCAEPTRGVDVGSVELIHREILKYRDEGAGILLISSQLEELMALSDHIYVMFEGTIVKKFSRGSFSESAIGRAMGGGG